MMGWGFMACLSP